MENVVHEDDYLAHYGILRRSGRYPWGSGGNIPQRSRDFLDYVENMKRQGLTETEIARGVGLFSEDGKFSTTDLRAAKSIAKAQKKAADIAMAEKLKNERGWSNTAIAERMGINESSVRALLAPGAKDKADLLQATSMMLKDQVADKKFVDIGSGTENHIGVSATRLNTAVSMLKAEGYEVHNVQVPQVGTNQKTLVKVLAPPGTTYRDIVSDPGSIKTITDFSEDGGRSFLGVMPPLSVDSKRIGVVYGEEGGKADGTIYVRPGVEDLSMGSARYAQVRIAVDGTHYLKGMAVYNDNLPDGVDLLFNTPKKDTGNKLDAMKPMKDEPDNPFGATIRQRIEVDSSGNPKVTSALNIVGGKDGLGEEGAWDTWSKNLPTQFLSKQSRSLAREQLDKTYAQKKEEFDEINSLTNPIVKKQLLESFADSTDSSAVHLKAAAMPRQSTHVLLPINSLSDTEVYAPNFKQGERVVLVRFPHGGTFEIPELVVNNENREGKRLLGSDAKDAIGINARVASRLSGADFDGDTVLVIPNDSNKIKTSPALEKLKNFNPQESYKAYDGMRTMDGGVWSEKEGKAIYPEKGPSSRKGYHMGVTSNLITDMSVKRASADEIARAVRHSMVVIDAEKHGLDYRRSAIENGIPQLMEKYQKKSTGGASTLISLATNEGSVPERRLRKASEGGPIDPKTGRLVYKETGAFYIDKAGRRVEKVTRGDRLALTDDAHTLSSGTVIEKIYADHSNRLKDLANQARREAVNTKRPAYSPSAKKAFAEEVQSLNDKLNLVQRNRPLERQAQVIANQVASAKKASNPFMDKDDIKKVEYQALAEARRRTGAKRHEIYLTDNEWKAIQAGAISSNKLEQILRKSDLTRVKELATPRTKLLMTGAKTSRAKSLLSSGLTQSEVAQILGVSLTTLKNAL